MLPPSPPLTNKLVFPAPHVGMWGGSCTCPDGQSYWVGDNIDLCASLACVGGVSGACWSPDFDRFATFGTKHVQLWLPRDASRLESGLRP